MRKRAEGMLRAMLKFYNWGWHKYGDVRYCVHCHKPLPKSENMPDFSAWMVYTWIEAKNNAADGSWRWTEIAPDGERANQRRWLHDNNGWLFIELGKGKAPKGKGAYLIPFDEWENVIEPVLIAEDIKSLRFEATTRRPGANVFLSLYKLEWSDGRYQIPKGHLWWHRAYIALELELEKVKGYLDGATQ